MVAAAEQKKDKRQERKELKAPIAFIPMRAGSKRIPGKNFKPFCGMPLFMYTLISAAGAGIFDKIIISTDDPEKARDIINHFPGKYMFKNNLIVHERPGEIAGDKSLDIEWITDIFDTYDEAQDYDHYMILRPTSPFRTYATIRRAWEQYKKEGYYKTALKSVQRWEKSPGKLWEPLDRFNIFFEPSIKITDENKTSVPPHEAPIKPNWLYMQDGCIDICPVSISRDMPPCYIGYRIIPFFPTPTEGIDLNTQLEWDMAECFFAALLRGRYSYVLESAELQFLYTGPGNRQGVM